MLKLKIKKSQLFLIANLFFIIGILAGFFIKFNPFYLYLIFLILSVFLAIFYNKNFIKIILLILCFLIFGIWRYNIGLPKIDESHISFYNESRVEFIGIVSEEPDERIDNIKLTVKAVELVEARLPLWKPSFHEHFHGNVLITTKLFPKFSYGDELKIGCNLQTPESFNDFAYDKYLSRYDIYSVCYYPQIELLNKNRGNKFFAGIYKFKDRLKLVIGQSLPEPQSSLLSAIILGFKRGIPKELADDFSKVGISHIVAISGMHIAILAMILLYLGIMLGLNRNQAFYFSCAFLFFYIALIGFPPSAVRAGIMGFLILLAMRLGRLAKATNAIVFAAALMLLANPLLIYDIGFQLSFLAVLGLIYILPILEKPLEKFTKHWKLNGFLKSFLSLILITLSAQIATLPVILYNFGRLSMVAPIVNILAVPSIPFIMILGLILLVCGLVWTSLGQAVGWIIWLVLSYVIYIVNFFAKFNFSSIDVKISWGAMIIFLVAISGFVFIKKSADIRS
ncbi:MAG: ComEC/Rec2 family competence protein [bacterium]